MRAKLLILFYLAAFCPALFAQPADTLKLYETGPVEVIHPRREQPIISLYPVRDAYVLSQGKKTEVLEINPVFINTVENNPRQVFNKIPGVMVWEMDGTGNQVSIATRGLNPHRSWELNVRQNGFILNSDVFGYPEAHYNPPIQAVQRIEMIRGAGALQYGQQFGGMLNYVLKEGGPGPVSVESETSVGSFGLFGSYTAIGGTKGKWKYYGYYNHRNSDGWRKNSDYTFDAWHVGATCSVNKKINIHAEVSRMAYINHFAAGLSDSMFRADARQSNRSRNYFSPDMYIAAIRMNWELTEKTRFQISASAILGQRNSVQFIGSPLVADTLGPRIVDRDYYNSYSAEAKLMHEYRLFKRQHTVLAGIRWINNTTLRSQQGGGTTAGDYDLSLISPYKIDINFHTDGYAGFIENSFSIAKKLTATAGIRYEVNSTSMRGKFFNTRAEDIPVGLNRNILLGGVGIQYSVSPHMQVYGNFSQAYRPVLYSDILPASPLDRVNPGLKDAYGSNSEAGIRGSIENLLFYDITLFAMVYNNRAGQVIQEENSNVYFYKTNIGNTLATGIEYYLELFVSRYFKKLASQGLNMSVYTSGMYNNASYTSGIVAKGAENINVTNNRLENAPEFINRAGINFYYRGFSTAVQASHVSSMYTDALNTQSTPTGVNGIVPAYTVFDFNMAYAITEKVNIRASINNFTDKMYYTRRATGYPGPGILPSDGRSFVITLSAGVD